MKVRIKADFSGYPDGDDKAPREFRAGQTIEVDDAFARLILDKGHAWPMSTLKDASPHDPSASDSLIPNT